VLIFISGKGEVWFDDVSGRPVSLSEAQAASGEPVPGLFEARGAYKVTASANSPKPTFLVPLPLSYREQVPLTYELMTEPAEKLAKVRVYRDKLSNYVAEVVLERSSGRDGQPGMAVDRPVRAALVRWCAEDGQAARGMAPGGPRLAEKHALCAGGP